jgi:hypothetical protein
VRQLLETVRQANSTKYVYSVFMNSYTVCEFAGYFTEDERNQLDLTLNVLFVNRAVR